MNKLNKLQRTPKIKQKGHIMLQKADGTRSTLCGSTGEVKPTYLYGEMCGNCCEIARIRLGR
jgi:hypothetical protein